MPTRHHQILLCFLSLFFLLLACRGNDPVIADPDSFLVTADKDAVFTVVEGDRQSLKSPNKTTLTTGDGVDVGENGRAIVNFADLLTVEVLRNGALTVQEVSIDEQSAVVTILQNGGTLINNFDPTAEINKRFTVKSDFAEISATGTRFVTINEPENSLEWVFALESGADDLSVTGPDGTTKFVETGIARWVASTGEPSAGIPVDLGRVETWINELGQAENLDEPLPDFGDIVFQPANTIATLESLNALPQVGVPFEIEGVVFTLETPGTYSLEDCNADGILDLASRTDGIISLDFRNVLNSVTALDITVLRRSSDAFGWLTASDPGRALIDSVNADWSAGEFDVMSLRSPTLIHYGAMNLSGACFLGFSLTPPTESGEPGPPVPAVDTNGPFVSIDTPEEGSGNTTNGFLLEGRASVPFERFLTLTVRSIEGEEILREGIFVDGGEPGGAPGIFAMEVFLDMVLPADILIEVANISAVDGTTLAADSIILRPLNPAVGEPPILARPPENGEFFAPYVPGYLLGITVDGFASDWFDLGVLSERFPTPIERIVYDEGCSDFYPLDDESVDLAATAQFAWDEEFLYLMFIVEDESYYPYSDSDAFIFLGDAPQVILDLFLADDFSDSKNSGDDIEIDFFPGDRDGDELYSQRLAIWRLDSLEGESFTDFLIASVISVNGYNLEAAIPWEFLGVFPEPGMAIGVAASVSDNDYSDGNVQQCMVSSAPDRDFSNPTTWGTLFILPEP